MKNKIRQKLLEALRKREEAMNDPNNPLYALRSNYYRNNYSALSGIDQELFKLRRFPLFKLLKEMQEEERPSYEEGAGHQVKSSCELKMSVFKQTAPVKEENVLSYKYKQMKAQKDKEKQEQEQQ